MVKENNAHDCQEELMYEMRYFVLRFQRKRNVYLYVRVDSDVCICTSSWVSVLLVKVYCRILLSNTSLGSIVIYLNQIVEGIAHAHKTRLYLPAIHIYRLYPLYVASDIPVYFYIVGK